MKCPRCRREMERQKTKEHVYRYVCPNCKFVLKGSSEEKKQDEEEEQ